MSVYPTWLAGSRVTAAQLSGMQRMVIVAQSTQTVTNSTTKVNDNELVFSLAANAVYVVEFSLFFWGSTAAVDLSLQWTVPSGSTGLRHIMSPTLTSASFTSREDTRSKFAAHLYGTSSVIQIDVDSAHDTAIFDRSVITTSSTSGNVSPSWAMFTAAGAGTTLNRDANSFMSVQRVG